MGDVLGECLLGPLGDVLGECLAAVGRDTLPASPAVGEPDEFSMLFDLLGDMPSYPAGDESGEPAGPGACRRRSDICGAEAALSLAIWMWVPLKLLLLGGRLAPTSMVPTVVLPAENDELLLCSLLPPLPLDAPPTPCTRSGISQ